MISKVNESWVTVPTPVRTMIKKLICFIVGHHLGILRRFNFEGLIQGSDTHYCKRCGKIFNQEESL